MQKTLLLLMLSSSIFLSSCKKEIIQYNLTTSVYPLSGGSVSPSSGSFETGQNINVLATPSAEYLFKEWQGDLVSSSNPLSVLMDKNKNLIGTFEKRQYPLNLTIEGSGTVKEDIVAYATNSKYPSGTTVKLTPVALDGWKFLTWSGDNTTNTNPLTIIVDKQISLTATFKMLDQDTDGVNDFLDKCPNTPANEKADNNGCSYTQVDTDGDGVVDIKDADNTTRKGVPVDDQGRMLNPVFLDANGVTIKANKWAIVGDKGFIKGIEYTVVNEEILRAMVNKNEDVSKVVTTLVKSGKDLFLTKFTFNQNIASWDVSNFVDMTRMFSGIIWSPRVEGPMAFNQDISYWDVSKVKSMEEMFIYCEKFTQNLNKWNTSSVENMSNMFREAKNYNQPMDKWDVSKVMRFDGLFLNAIKFNQNINSWNTISGNDFTGTFWGCGEFNQPLSNWNVSNAYNFSFMFYGCFKFNQPIGNWKTSTAYSFRDMFFNCSNFNQPLENWDVSNAFIFAGMFNSARSFNQPLNNWTIKKANTMAGMFANSNYNQDISNWDVSQVTNMENMFYNSTFNQNLSKWNVANVSSCSNFALNTPNWTLPKPNFKNCSF